MHLLEHGQFRERIVFEFLLNILIVIICTKHIVMNGALIGALVPPLYAPTHLETLWRHYGDKIKCLSA